jgi:hypothetical protein
MSTARSSRGQDDGVGALPVKMKPRTEADTKPRAKDLRNDPFTQTQVAKKDINTEEYEAVATSGKETSNVDLERIKEKRSLASNLDASSVTQTSALGVAALPSISMSRSTGTVRARKENDKNSVEEEQPGTRVGAVAMPGLSPSRHTSDHSEPTNGVTNDDDSLLPPAIGEEQPLQAMLVADLVTDEADVEAQVQERMHRILQNTPTALILDEEVPGSGANEAGKTRKKIYILAGVLAIAAAIGIALGITLSNPPPPPDPIEPFRDALVSISRERLDDKNSPQYQALDWIANDDPAKTSVGVNDTEIIKQRYVAAVLYFALAGKDWKNQYNFLSGDDICLWNQNELSGIICGSLKGNVESLNLSESLSSRSRSHRPRENMRVRVDITLTVS